jgi:hypothetical protein
MLNMAVNVHLVPVTGLTLPMISMGGSSIWFTSIAIGIVLSVSRYVDEMEGERKGQAKNIDEIVAQEEKIEETEEVEQVLPPTGPSMTTTTNTGTENKIPRKPRVQPTKDNTPLPAI